MTTDDLALINATRGDMTPYEHFAMAEHTSRRPSNTAIAGVVLGSVGAAVGIGAWIFGGIYAAGRANSNKALIDANAEHSRQMENLLATSITNERTERVNGYEGPSIMDYVNVTQQGSQNASASASALAQAEATLLTNALTGQSQMCPQRVSLYSAPQPCSCPCGSN